VIFVQNRYSLLLLASCFLALVVILSGEFGLMFFFKKEFGVFRKILFGMIVAFGFASASLFAEANVDAKLLKSLNISEAQFAAMTNNFVGSNGDLSVSVGYTNLAQIE
jgi:hypothetical protein